MTIIEDVNNKPGKHDLKNAYFRKAGIDVVRQRLPVGDYIIENDKVRDVFARKEKRGIPIKMMDLLGTYDVAVDSKNSIQELCGDVCGKSHERFRDELILAQNNGIRLVILVENDDGISQLSELHKWVNPRLFIRERGGKQKYPNATRGVTLMKACYTMTKKYGCIFAFCRPDQAGKNIVTVLGGYDG